MKIQEIEQTLQEKNILSDEGMVYEGSNVHSLPSKGKENLKKIIKEHAMLFEDDTYFYVVMNDAELLTLQGRKLSEEQLKFATDFSVDKLKKAQYSFLSELAQVAEEEAIEEVAEEEGKDIDNILTTYSNLAAEISQAGNIKLKQENYTYDTGATTITITEDNKVIDGDGAVIDMKGSNIQAFHVTASGVTIRNLTIKNAKYDGDGGAIYFDSTGMVQSCRFMGNCADFGGAVCFNGEGTVVDCSFEDNQAYRGGAICFFSSGESSDCYFSHNTAEEGGALWLVEGGVYGSIFEHNNAHGGGEAIYCSIFNDRTEIRDCVFNFQPSAVWAVGGVINACCVVEDCHFNYCKSHSADRVGNEVVDFKGCYFIEFTLDEARKVVDRLNHKYSYLNGFEYYDIEGNTLYINPDKLRELVDALAETVSVASYDGACCHGRHTAFEEFLAHLEEPTRLLRLYSSSTYGIRPNAVCQGVFDSKVSYRNFNALLGLLPAVLERIQLHVLNVR